MQSANAGVSRRNAHGSQGTKRKNNTGVYPTLSGVAPQNNAMEEVKSKQRRQAPGNKPPISDGYSGAAGSQQLVDENGSENMPNLHSALQGADQSSDDDVSPNRGQNDDMYYEN